MKAGVVRMARAAPAGLELLDGAADRPADAALGRFRESEIAIFEERPQAFARPLGAVDPRQHDPGFQLGHDSSCCATDAGWSLRRGIASRKLWRQRHKPGALRKRPP